MLRRPFLHDAQSALWQRTGEDRTISDRYQRLEPLLARMKMRRRMLAVKHADDDAEEDRDEGHRRDVCLSGGRAQA